MNKIIKINNRKEYDVIMTRFDDLALSIAGNAPQDENAPVYIEMKLLADLIELYEKEHFSIAPPTFIETLKLRIEEMSLTQVNVAKLIGVSPSRVSEYLSGKSEPTLQVARAISKELKIDANIILGV